MLACMFMCSTCSLTFSLLARASMIYLNRGNHEDRVTCSSYGFLKEVERKCNNSVFATIDKVFQAIPVCTIVDGEVLVVHGGILDEHVTIQELEECDRRTFKGRPISEKRKSQMSEHEFRLASVMLGALWSDPHPTLKHGVRPSPRGAGSAFSAEATKHFLAKNELKMIIRSHEVCKSGFIAPFQSMTAKTCPILVTVFSASDYSKRMHNEGSVIRFTKQDGKNADKGVGLCFQLPKSKLAFRVQPYTHAHMHCLIKYIHSTQIYRCSREPGCIRTPTPTG